MCITDGSPAGGTQFPEATEKHNTWSAWPAMRGLSRFYTITVTCQGEPNPTTGYFINITDIDHAVREHCLPYLQDLLASPENPADLPLGETVRSLINLIQPALDETVTALTLHLSPYLSLTVRSQDMDRVIIKQQYEFSAAHRLHSPSLSDEENKQTFGKCNNPEGHGHNYLLDINISLPIDPLGHIASVQELDELVDSTIIQSLDHKHLNNDTDIFNDINPSVENISKYIYETLAPKVDMLGSLPGATLESITLFETAKTACTYPAPPEV